MATSVPTEIDVSNNYCRLPSWATWHLLDTPPLICLEAVSFLGQRCCMSDYFKTNADDFVLVQSTMTRS